MGVIIGIILLILLVFYKAFNRAEDEIQNEKAKEKGVLCYMDKKGVVRLTSNGERVVIKQDQYDHRMYVYDGYGTDKLIDLTQLIINREKEEVDKINKDSDNSAIREGRRWSVRLWFDPGYWIKTKYGSYRASDIGRYCRTRFDLINNKEYEIGFDGSYYVIYKDDPMKKVYISEDEANELGYGCEKWYDYLNESPDNLYNRIMNEFYIIGV